MEKNRLSIILTLLFALLSAFIFFSGCNSTTCTPYYPNITVNKISENVDVEFLNPSVCYRIIEYEVVNQGETINDTVTIEIKMKNSRDGNIEDTNLISIPGLGAHESKRGTLKFKGHCLGASYEFQVNINPLRSCN